MLWRYFDKVDLYTSKCTFCEKIFKEAYIPGLKRHLRHRHIHEIKAAIYQEIANKSLSQNFEIDEDILRARCKFCNKESEIFYGTHYLIYHMQSSPCSRYRNQLIDNNVNRMIQQSIADENASTTSHHDNINRQAPGYRENEQR